MTHARDALRHGPVVHFRCSRRIGEYKAAGNMAYDTAVCFRRKRKVSISDDGDRSSLSRTRTSRAREAAGRDGKGVRLRGISQGGLGKSL